MDQMQQINLRLTLAVKGLERNMPVDLGFNDLQAMFAWVVGPEKTIVPAFGIPSVQQ